MNRITRWTRGIELGNEIRETWNASNPLEAHSIFSATKRNVANSVVRLVSLQFVPSNEKFSVGIVGIYKTGVHDLVKIVDASLEPRNVPDKTTSFQPPLVSIRDSANGNVCLIRSERSAIHLQLSVFLVVRQAELQLPR